MICSGNRLFRHQYNRDILQLVQLVSYFDVPIGITQLLRKKAKTVKIKGSVFMKLEGFTVAMWMTQSTVGSFGVIAFPPAFDDDLRFA